ncbi:NAD(P)-binding protein [Plenodomus tracheiphilus IPT5]|uniref:NAD(P)-binding protein n=1 Tax=Plenodomus tracheiphilus IPT5 TaxID=1408161 RepID=A0A6A7BFY9_9PLEO|nr:NAD(P)-binding protein [Plenodomus tracheiphilus IPT5]
MTQPITIVVTGSNRGIGRGIIQLLASTQHTRPLKIHATSRSGSDLQVTPSHSNTIHYSKLDISSLTSITEFLHSTVKNDIPIDILINNAGINNNNRETPSLAQEVINVNYHGTKNMCLAFLNEGQMAQNPLARIVNVSSTASQLSNYASSLQQQFRSVQSTADVDALSSAYLATVSEGGDAQKAEGWGAGPRSYQVSKACINALTVVLASEYPRVLVNCCCPGWVDTDMGHQVGTPSKTLEEGSRIPVRLAIGELGVGGDGDGDGGLEKVTEAGWRTERVSGRYFGNDGVGDRGWRSGLGACEGVVKNTISSVDVVMACVRSVG